MMNKLILLFSLALTVAGNSLSAQDTLPKFSAKNIGNNRIVIGWVNKFENIKQIGIQRSFDSLKNYKTILTVADPTTPENGYVDTKASNDRMFYRLYILLDKGVFLFSDAKRAVLDTVIRKDKPTRLQNGNFTIPIIDSGNGRPVVTNNGPRAEVWAPSKHVFTYKDGYIRINLPEDDTKKYSIKFFTAADEFLFELKDIKEKSFKIDKANFYKSGWFKFEMYENGELKEKNKFYLPKEF
ncbi:MAG: hypothetical protein EOO01_18795 [Chitinophagaceae bacterium]|nr:MAG: hypothetical protein EOO01_18795 [Chitinophagaceae bacterium]